jgi:hypothetical protein
LGQIVSTSEHAVAEDGEIWMPIIFPAPELQGILWWETIAKSATHAAGSVLLTGR